MRKKLLPIVFICCRMSFKERKQQKYVRCNPGYVVQDPHTVLEGSLVSGLRTPSLTVHVKLHVNYTVRWNCQSLILSCQIVVFLLRL